LLDAVSTACAARSITLQVARAGQADRPSIACRPLGASALQDLIADDWEGSAPERLVRPMSRQHGGGGVVIAM